MNAGRSVTLLWCVCCWYVLLVAGPTNAGYDQTCSREDYSTRSTTSTCSTRLTSTILRLCSRRGGAAGAKTNVKRSLGARSNAYGSIFSSAEKASSFLRPASQKRRFTNGHGVVCECCVHRCTFSEMLEYCANPRESRRRRRSLGQKQFGQSDNVLIIRNDADVEEFYNAIERDSKDANSEPIVDFVEFENQPLIKLIERQKAINLQQENLKRSSSESKGESSSEVKSDEQNILKDYLRAKFRDMLLHTGGNQAPTTTPPTSDVESENEILNRLYELFQEEMGGGSYDEYSVR